MPQGKAVIGQSGGPTAVINRSLVGFIKEATKLDFDEILGARLLSVHNLFLYQHLMDTIRQTIPKGQKALFALRDEVAGWILELDRGQGIPYEGNYSGWLEQKQKRMEQEGRQDASRMRSLAEELEWVRASPRGRQAKSKARLTAYEELLAQGQENL